MLKERDVPCVILLSIAFVLCQSRIAFMSFAGTFTPQAFLNSS